MESSTAIIVIAKEPAPGRAKTRLQQRFTADHAAELAGAAVRDTLRAAREAEVSSRFLCWQGFGASAAAVTTGLSNDFELIDQRAGDLGARLAGAFADVWTRTGSGDAPSLLIGMDTPQVRTADLDVDWGGADAVLGLAEDGGFWAIGLRRCDPIAVFEGIEMSTDRTGSEQLARLHSFGWRVRLLPSLRDVDTPDDAQDVAERHPDLEFSRVHRQRVAS